MSQEWWTEDEDGGDASSSADDDVFERHAVDHRRYSRPDDRLAATVGSRAICVPRANRDGTSSGFVADVAGVVHVDPDQRDRGVIIDLSKLSDSAIANAMMTSQRMHEPYYKLAATAAPIQAAPTSRSLTPAMYANRSENAMPVGNPPSLMARQPSALASPPPPPLPPQAQAQAPAAMLATAPPPADPYHPPAGGFSPPQYPQYAYPPQHYPPPQYQPAPPQSDPVMMQILQGLTEAVQKLQQREAPSLVPTLMGPPPVLHRNGQAAPIYEDETPVGDAARARPTLRRPALPTAPAEDDEELSSPQDLRAYQNRTAAEGNPERVVAGFETLKIAFIDGPLGAKPKHTVYFDLGPGGKLSAKFHDVIDAENAIVLVFDRRYEDGTQYIPPENPDMPITIGFAASKLKSDKQDKTYQVRSVGLTFQEGVLDYILLVKEVEPSTF